MDGKKDWHCTCIKGSWLFCCWLLPDWTRLLWAWVVDRVSKRTDFAGLTRRLLSTDGCWIAFCTIAGDGRRSLLLLPPLPPLALPASLVLLMLLSASNWCADNKRTRRSSVVSIPSSSQCFSSTLISVWNLNSVRSVQVLGGHALVLL